MALGFLAGVIVALTLVSYLSIGRNAELRDAAISQAGPPATREPGAPGAAAPAGNPSIQFASRMTYELSPLPEDLTAPPPTLYGLQPGRSSPADISPQRSTALEKLPTSRVVNPRPITATPLDPRDTTRGIENERRRAEYRERLPGQQATPAQPRFIEGRELVLPPSASAPAKAEPSMVAAAGAVGADIESRLAATREWLESAPQTTHTIQILGASNDVQLKAYLKTLPRTLDPNKIYVFRTTVHGKRSTTVAYGAYADRQAALNALQALPESVAANRPVLRTVKGIRAEITQRKSDS